MSNEKQLPPELVEKFYNELPQWVNNEDAEKCAQIAVDYAQSIWNVQELESAIEQRDELLEALRKTTSLGYQQKTHHNDKKWKSTLENNELLIQKYDGK